MHMHYLKNKQKYLESSKRTQTRHKKENQEFIINYLTQHKCMYCDNSDIRVLEFHHIKNNKEYGIATMIRHESLDKLKNEINKCIVLCANCHAKIHQSDSYKTGRISKNKIINRNKKYVLWYLQNNCCSCGETDPLVLEFHHINKKIKSVSKLLSKESSLNKIKEEINRCKVLCRNCHKCVHSIGTYRDIN